MNYPLCRVHSPVRFNAKNNTRITRRMNYRVTAFPCMRITGHTRAQQHPQLKTRNGSVTELSTQAPGARALMEGIHGHSRKESAARRAPTWHVLVDKGHTVVLVELFQNLLHFGMHEYAFVTNVLKRSSHRLCRWRDTVVIEKHCIAFRQPNERDSNMEICQRLDDGHGKMCRVTVSIFNISTDSLSMGTYDVNAFLCSNRHSLFPGFPRSTYKDLYDVIVQRQCRQTVGDRKDTAREGRVWGALRRLRTLMRISPGRPQMGNRIMS